MQLRNMVFCALLASVICVFAPFSIPVGPVPISLATFAIYIASTVIGRKQGVVSVLIYIAIGAVGVPVFSNFSGGIAKLVGVTGGYIAGYVFLAAIAGYIVDKNEGAFWAYPVGMAAGTLVLYAFGSCWFIFTTENGILATITICVLPFLVGDALKIAAASAISFALRKLLKRFDLGYRA